MNLRTQQGVTATNPNVNIVQWFGDNIFGDLRAAASGRVHPALQVDAIRYLYTFRYQVRFFCSRSRVLRIHLCLSAHEGATGLCAAAAPEPPRVPGSRGVHVCCGGTRSHLVHARWRLHDAHVRLQPLPALAPPSRRLGLTVKFAGSRPRTCNRSRPSF